MKNVIEITVLSICILCFSNLSLVGQDTKKGKYKVWITKLDTSSKAKGYVSEVGDSTLTIMNSSKDFTQSVHIDVIDEIKFRKNGNVGRGILKGALIGASIGAILGFLSGDDNQGFVNFDAEWKAMVGATVMAPIGALIGGIIGHSTKVVIPIRGNQKTYKGQQERIKEYIF